MMQLKAHARRCKINAQQSTTDRIRRWIWDAKEMEKNAEKYQKTTKRYFEV